MKLKGQDDGVAILKLLFAAVAAIVAVISFLFTRAENPVTGENQYVALSVEQEIALGLKAAPQMAAQFGGLDQDGAVQHHVDALGQDLIDSNAMRQSPYTFEFHVLADEETINAFALPGGQIFITRGLYDALETDGQLAGVLAHEIGHVIQRHSAQQLAKAQLTQGLGNAAMIAAYDPQSPATAGSATIAAVVGQLVTMKYGRDDELESDAFAVRIMAEAEYDPNSMLRLMEILADAGGRAGLPEFFSTHPSPENRIQRLKEAIHEVYPEGPPPESTK